MVRPGPKADDTSGLARSPLFVASLGKGLKVLLAFNQHQRLRLSDVVRLTELDKSAAQRFLHTLTALGFLRQDSVSKCYSLTPKVLRLASGFIHTNPLLQHALRHLRDCNQRSGESANLLVLDDIETVFVGRVQSSHPLDAHYAIGDRLPAYCTGGGLAILAFLPPEEARAILRRSELAQQTPASMTDEDALMRRLAEARARGYVISNEEMYLGIMSVASAVLTSDGYPLAAVTIGAPTARWTLATAERDLSPLVVQAVRSLSAELEGIDLF